MTDADFDALRREMLPKMPAMLADAIAAGEQTWTTEELKAEFEVKAFRAPFAMAMRKADGVVGSLMFAHEPRIYFGWQPDEDKEMACGTCHGTLNRWFPPDGGPVEWSHAGYAPGDGPGHEARPVPRDSLDVVIEECDFCASKDIAAYVKVAPFEQANAYQINQFKEDWAACADCARGVRRGDWNGILRRTLKGIERKHGIQATDEMRAEIRRLHASVDENLIGIEWLPSRKPKSAAPEPKARPSVRFAKDVPEAQSKLIRFLEQHAPSLWAEQFRKSGYRSLRSFATDRAPVYDGSRGFAIPGEFDKGGRVETAHALARWQAWAVRESTLHFVNETMTGRVVEAAADLPEFEIEPELVPHDIGLLCWAKPVAGHAIQITAMSWCPIEGGMWLTFYNDTALSPYDEHSRTVKGWLEEAGTMAVPWGGSSHAGAQISDFLTEGFRTLLTTWLFMGDTILAEVREESLPPKDARKIRRRGHPAPAVQYVSLRKVIRPRAEEEKAEATGRKYHGTWQVTGHWRHYKAERYKPEVRSRPQWIEPYRKGDAEEPTEKTPRTKVYTLRK